MGRYLLAVLSLAMVASTLLPVTTAGAQSNSTPWASTGSTCSSLTSFQRGCEVSGGTWSDTFSDFAAANGISSSSNVGAQVQYFPQGSQPLEEVMYLVGPYLAAESEAGDYDNVTAEIAGVEEIADVIDPLRVRLRDLDASIVYIGFGDFEDSQQPVAQRVAAVKSAIRSFENLRQSNLGHEPHATALMGISLGGVAGKIALSELEAEGFDHGVETYISFDSPHWGAYTPPAIQKIPTFMEDSFRWAERGFSWTEALYDNPLDDGRDAAALATSLTLESPVAQDLLMVNVAYDNWQSPNISYVRDRYRDLPTNTDRNVAIASGSITGEVPNLGTEYFSFDTGDADVLDFRLEMDASIPTTSDPATFSGSLSYKAVASSGTFIPYPEWKTIGYTSGPNNLGTFAIENFERSSCAHSTEIVDGVAEVLQTSIGDTGLWDNFQLNVSESRACFIPTFSAVIGSSTVAGGTPAGVTQFDHVIGNDENKSHLAVSGNMQNEILSEMDRVFASSPSAPAAVPAPNPTPEPTPTPAPAGCDFWSGTHNLDDTRAMFPEQCGTGWNDQVHKCDYTNEGWHCSDIAGANTPVPAPVANPAPEPTPTPAPASCDFWSGTHNLDDTRAMFPEQCGTGWNDQVHKCEYTNEGWHCSDIA